MKILLLITLFIFLNSILIKKEFIEKAKRDLSILGKDKTDNYIKRIKNNILSKLNKGSSLFSTNSQSSVPLYDNICVNYPITIDCKDRNTKEERARCFTISQICNQYKGIDGWESLAYLYYNSSETAFANNQITYLWDNDYGQSRTPYWVYLFFLKLAICY